MKKTLIALSMGAMMTSTALAADFDKIKEMVSAAAGVDQSAIEVGITPSENLYEVRIASQVFYTTKDGRLIIVGNVHDMKTQENLTEKAQVELAQASLKQLSENDLVIYEPVGEVKGEFTLFSDIECPYCAKLHKEIPDYQKAGIRVKIALYPRAGEGSSSYYKSVSAKCASNSQKALDELMSDPNKKVGLVEDESCQSSVKKVLKVGEMVGLQGTPLIYTSKGQKVEGYVPSAKLIEAILAN